MPRGSWLADGFKFKTIFYKLQFLQDFPADFVGAPGDEGRVALGVVVDFVDPGDFVGRFGF